jgi:hypothetical protein
MQTLLVHQRRAAGRALIEAVQEPAVADHADLEQHSVLGPCFLQMKPALLDATAIGTEDRFPRERLRSGERMHLHEQGVIDAVELHGFTDRCLDHARIALDGRCVLTHAVEPVEDPHLSGVYLPVGERAQGGCDDGKSQHITSRARA